MNKDYLKIGKYKLKSRLIVGTGKYKSFKETADAIKASGAEIVTVAVRRVNISDKKKPLLMDYVNPKNDLLEPLIVYLERHGFYPVLLNTSDKIKPGAVDNKWKVDVNLALESDI